MTSIVIPAHNEASVIGRCLEAILSDAEPDEFDIVVVANGCTDDTIAVASRYAPAVRVLDAPVASKTAALDAGDRIARSFPRLYVDADVVVDTESIRKVAKVLEDEPGTIAAPRLRFALAGRPWSVRAFYDVWSRLPYIADAMVGSGFYGVSADARASFDEFPQTFAEDFFIRSVVPPERRRTVADASFVVHPPLTLRSLIRVRTRIAAANRAGRPLFSDEQDRVGRGHRHELAALAAIPSMWPRVAVYVMVVVAARLGARRAHSRTGDLAWVRDQTARTARV